MEPTYEYGFHIAWEAALQTPEKHLQKCGPISLTHSQASR